MAKHQIAIEHVLTKTAMSAQNQSVYREYVLENKSIGEVSVRYGITRNYVSQIKARVKRAVELVERELYGK